MSKVDLSTHYLGMTLKNPIVPSASPLSFNLSNVKRMEDSGAAAVVMYSLFEEQITHEMLELFHHTSYYANSNAEASNYLPDYGNYLHGPDEYVAHLHKIKESVDIPVIGSLNGCTDGGWTKYAKLIEEAGADALELNIYMLATDINTSSADIEQIYIETLRSVKANISIPVAMKISPYISAMGHFAKELDKNGVEGLVLFNRFYQPDIDLEKLEVVPNIILSNAQSMRLPLRWIAILYGRINASLAATSGVYSAEDVIKLTMVGASATQMFAALHKNGIEHIKTVLEGVEKWMVEHEYESLKQMRGSMSHKSAANPGEFERANYMKGLRSFQP